MEENTEEKLLREHFQKFQRSKRANELPRKGSYNARSTNNLKRKSFHRLDSTKKSHSDNTLINFSSLCHHTYHEHDLLSNTNTSCVYKIKSNSIPRSSVERKQRRKRTKMCKKMENKLGNNTFTPLNSQNLLTPLPIPTTKPTSNEPAPSVSSSSSNKFVSKVNNDRVVYL